MISAPVIIRQLGCVEYHTAWLAMQQFTNQRSPETPDEIWLLEHPPIFTQGQNGKAEHILNAGEIPVIQVDRGGQVTYHGPGQLIAYTLIDVKRKKFTVRELIVRLEKTIINLLADYQITALGCREAPGVYVAEKKICSVGLRIRKGASYHGLALNVAMDLAPYSRINPCGFAQLAMTQVQHYQPNIQLSAVKKALIEHLLKNLGYTGALINNEGDL